MKKTIDKVGLKPCPFCGAPARLMANGDPLCRPTRYFVTCVACGVETPRTARTPAQARDAWNRGADNDTVVHIDISEQFKKECEFEIKAARAEAIKQFALALKQKQTNAIHCNRFECVVSADDIDNLVREMVGDQLWTKSKDLHS